MAGGRGATAAQRLQQGSADPRLHLEAGSRVSVERARGACTPRASVPGPWPRGAQAAQLRAALTSELPQTQPDGSAQASGPTLSAPGPWKCRRPARDSRKAVRASLTVYFCGGRVASGASPRRRQHREGSETTCPDCTGGRRCGSGAARAEARSGAPSPCRDFACPTHLAQSPDAAHAHGAGAQAHPERGVGREDGVVVAAGHAFGVHKEEAVCRVAGAPQARVVPREAVGVEEECRGTCAGPRP